MRKEFVLRAANREEVKHNEAHGVASARSRYLVKQLLPWAEMICSCESGWMAFESVAEAAVWKRQR